MSAVSQSSRLEKELKSLRDLFADAVESQDAARMQSLARVIVQLEKEIAKHRLAEGKTLDHKAVKSCRKELVGVIVSVGRKHLPNAEAYYAFVDDLLSELSDIWPHVSGDTEDED